MRLNDRLVALEATVRRGWRLALGLYLLLALVVLGGVVMLSLVRNPLRTLSSLRGLRGAPEVPPLCRETLVSRIANVGCLKLSFCDE